jgi:hypothetical protein
MKGKFQKNGARSPVTNSQIETPLKDRKCRLLNQRLLKRVNWWGAYLAGLFNDDLSTEKFR